MTAHEFVRRLKRQAGEPDRHYTFWLGAGCSVSSGIPAAAALVKDHWLPELFRIRGNPQEGMENWIKAQFPKYDPEEPAASYGSLMEELFPLADDKQRETERLCEGRDPGFGYAVLAALMSRADGIFSAALTTNFDDLVADAMYVYGKRRPLVIQHGSLAGFARPGRVIRPLVVKVHGDHRLNPMHTQVETAELEAGIQRGVQGLLRDRGVIFLGYAGNDLGVIRALEDLPPDAVPLGVWWVARREPTGAIRPWLEKRRATWVEAAGFDEAMLLLHKAFELAHPTAHKFEEMVESYKNTYETLDQRVDELPESAPDSTALKEASRRVKATVPQWWKVDLEARRVQDDDPARADEIYRDGLEGLEDVRLFGRYATFLWEVRRDADKAEQMFDRALEIDPSHPNTLSNYATFISTVRNEDDRAEEFYERTLAEDPEYAHALTNYAAFRWRKRKDPDRAQELYEQAIAADPQNSRTLSGYASFLREARDEHDRAEEFYERAIAANPRDSDALGSYAVFKEKVRHDADRAEDLYEKSLAVKAQHGGVLCNYAIFIADYRREIDRALEIGKRALEIEAEDPNNLGNYARMLFEAEKDGEAWEHWEKAKDRVEEDSLELELWFYALALGDDKQAAEAVVELKRLVEAEARTPGWNFDGIIDRARKRHHPDLHWLEILAKVLADEKDGSELNRWGRWKGA